MVSISPTCAVCIEKLAPMSDSSPTGTNSVVLKINAAMASITTRSHAVLRETVVDCIEINAVVEERLPVTPGHRTSRDIVFYLVAR